MDRDACRLLLGDGRRVVGEGDVGLAGLHGVHALRFRGDGLEDERVDVRPRCVPVRRVPHQGGLAVADPLLEDEGTRADRLLVVVRLASRRAYSVRIRVS